MPQKRPTRRCQICNQPEQRFAAFYTTISHQLGVCADCINRLLRQEKLDKECIDG